MIIAIDGPSGAGKSTLGKMLAKKFNLLYLDTGAMYRAGALAVMRSGISLNDSASVATIVSGSRIELAGSPDALQVLLDGANISDEIRSLEIAQAASIVSTNSDVRRRMVELQRELCNTSGKGCVLEGRDIGTVVFPGADAKFFLTAKPEARATRRFEEDKAKGRVTTYEQTLDEINRRDERDVSRDDSPLSIASDAVVIDTSDLDLSEVFDKMVETIKGLGSAAA
ncbi:MAG: (d)CMP kinase [Blastocatellia bacterium]|nr:(d)CMP kinase [Blastocatellia bacterium]